MRSLRRVSMPVAAVSFSLVASCSTSPEVGAGEKRPNIDLVRVENDADYVGPAQEILASTEEFELIRRAVDQSAAECVRARGSQFVPAGSSYPRWLAEDVLTPITTTQPWGPANRRRARIWGYHDPLAQSGPVADWWYAGRATAPEVVRECVARAAVGLAGRPPKGLPALVLQANLESDADPRIAAPLTLWRRCMAAVGLRYRNPGEAMRTWRDKPGRTIRAAERKTAVRSVRCSERFRTIDTLVALVAAYERRLLMRHADAFQAFGGWKETALRAARARVSSGDLPANARRREVR